jgi:hypothetical protein
MENELQRFCAAGPYRVNVRNPCVRNAGNKAHPISQDGELALRRWACVLGLGCLLQELIDGLSQVFGVVRHMRSRFKNVRGDAICIVD